MRAGKLLDFPLETTYVKLPSDLSCLAICRAIVRRGRRITAAACLADAEFWRASRGCCSDDDLSLGCCQATDAGELPALDSWKGH